MNVSYKGGAGMLAPTLDAIQAVKTLAFQQMPVNIVGIYKGMSFSERIQPLRVGLDHVVFRAPCLQVCLTLRDPVYLHSRILPETIRARPHMLNCTSQELRLSEFSYTGSLWYEREEQRVQPEQPVEVELRLGKQPYSTTLKDLSCNGAGLFVDLSTPDDPDISINTPVELKLQLSPGHYVHLAGSVTQRRKTGRSLMALGVRLHPTPIQKTWLQDYIAQRKLEIFNELEQQISSRLEPQRAESLYF
jgi:hypothetical protein